MTSRVLSTRVLVIFGLIASLIVGCTSAAQKSAEQTSVEKTQKTAPRSGGELVIAMQEKLPVFDPFGVSKKETRLHELERITYQGLFRHDDQYRLEPALASGYTIDRSQSKPAVVVTLRKGAVWSDGKPVTVDDVLFTYQEYARPYYYGVWREWSHLLEGVSPFRTGKAAAIAGITVDRERGTVRFALTRDDARFLQSLTAPLLARHQLAGKSTGEIDALSKAGKLLGTGPYRIASVSAQEWVFAKSSNPNGNKPRIERIRVVPLAQAKLEEELKAGRIHISWVSPMQAASLAKSDMGRIVPAAARGYHYVGFNLQSPALQDISIRRALAMAVSTEQLAEEAFYGWADPAQSPLAPGSFAYAPGKWPIFQPKEAARLLAQKGYSKEKPLQLTLVYPAHNQVRERLVKELGKAWEPLPVRLEKKAIPADRYVAYLYGGSKLDLYVNAWEYPADPAGLSRLWHSREKVGELGLNASRYQNPAADQWLDQGARLLSEAERKQAYAAWQRQFAQDLPIMPLVQVRNPYYVAWQVQGITEQLGLYPFANVADWWLETAE